MPTQSPLSQRSLDRLARQLTERRRVVAEMVEAFSMEALQAQQTADNSDRFDSESPVGTASDESFALAANAYALVIQIDHALSRLAAGVYGECEECGEGIPYRRLRAVPAATMCFACCGGTNPGVSGGIRKVEVSA